ncbi:hypothetical protein FACS189490_07560 [Clostridia bacterium]|nr:hypothetical protein FACS189490_07560 [Clostridia bacterium]
MDLQINPAQPLSPPQVQKPTRPAVPPPGATQTELKTDGYSDGEIKSLKASGKIECQTCANRTYVDGSDDAGVSFKTPTKLSPSQAATAVLSHEGEHVSRESAKASQEGKVASSSVTIFHSICPECGRSYVSGGVTRTQTRKLAENDSFSNRQFENTVGKYIGKNIGKNIDEEV